jgi:hypothetical protein
MDINFTWNSFTCSVTGAVDGAGHAYPFVKLNHHSDLPNHGVDRKISEVMISTKAEYNLD